MEPTTSYLWRIAGEALALLFRAAPGYEARLTQQASLALSGEPVADLNGAILDEGPQAEERLREFGQVIQARNLPILLLLTEGVSNQLAPVARELGLQYAGQIPLMTYRPSDGRAEARTYQVERVENEQNLQAASRIIASAFGFPLESVNRVNGPMLLDGPGVDIFLARQNGNPVSAVASTRAGSTVGIWGMGTSPEFQRKGAGRALLDYVIAYHYEHGIKLFYLIATEAGKPLYERIGFRTIAEAAAWVAGHSTQVGQAVPDTII